MVTEAQRSPRFLPTPTFLDSMTFPGPYVWVPAMTLTVESHGTQYWSWLCSPLVGAQALPKERRQDKGQRRHLFLLEGLILTLQS